MQTFQIVQFTPMFRGKGQDLYEEVLPEKLGHGQAVVCFPDGDTTRHLQHKTIRNDKGEVVAGPGWFGWNSDRTLGIRAGILESHKLHQESASKAAARVQKLTDEIGELKGKRGVTAKQAQLKEALKTAKATLAVAKGDLERVAAIAKRVDETHPDIVAFV